MATPATVTVSSGQFAVWQLYDALRYGFAISKTATSLVLEMDWSKSSLTVSGVGLAYDELGNLTSGVITGFALNANQVLLWKIEGASFPAEGFMGLVDIFRSTEDVAPLNSMMATNTWVMTGSYDSDNFTGGDFNDSMSGGWGGDVFVGGKGDDTIDGGPRWDNLSEESESGEDYDAVNYSQEGGSAGVIIDLTKSSRQVIDSWGSTDTVFNIEAFLGTDHADQYHGSNTSGFNIFTGFAGDDTINGGTGLRDEVRYDREIGTNGIKVDLDAVSSKQGYGYDSYGNNDTLIDIERVRGTKWNDEIRGNEANNIYRGYAGDDTLDGGSGFDRVKYDSDEFQRNSGGMTGMSGVVVDLESGYARDGFWNFDQLISIEAVDATRFSDRVLGSSHDNFLRTFGGSDYIDGREGNDTIEADDGNDKLLGGSGNDLMSGGGAADSLEGGVGADTLSGGAGWDTLKGGDGDDVAVFRSHRSNYTITQNSDGSILVVDPSSSGDGRDVIMEVEYFQFSDGTLSLAQLFAKTTEQPPVTDVVTPPPPPPPPPTPPISLTTGTSTTLPEGVQELMAIGRDNIQLTGNALDNFIAGNAGKNVINAGAGNDRLNGGLGSDTLIGSSGNDTFVFSAKPSSKNKDKIADYIVAHDTIQLDNAVFKKIGKKGSEAAPAKLNKKFFTTGSKAKDKNDYLIYDNKKGVLYYDADGSGKSKATVIATLSKKLKMNYLEFEII